MLRLLQLLKLAFCRTSLIRSVKIGSSLGFNILTAYSQRTVLLL